jgi:hypothetical protein
LRLPPALGRICMRSVYAFTSSLASRTLRQTGFGSLKTLQVPTFTARCVRQGRQTPARCSLTTCHISDAYSASAVRGGFVAGARCTSSAGSQRGGRRTRTYAGQRERIAVARTIWDISF